MWSAEQYGRYRDERARPFLDLLARVDPAGASVPRSIVDLGCGPGNLTALLPDRWPQADVLGIDSSPEMLRAAAPLAHERLRFEAGDARTWAPAGGPGSVGLLVTNATLQWVPGHLDRLAAFVDGLAPGGWFAMQVPANFEDPHHVAIRSLAASERWAPVLGTAWRIVDPVGEPADYADRLATLVGPDGTVDVWTTTYLHILTGADPVLEWVKGTALRPVLEILAPLPGAAEEFCAELAPTLRAAFPARKWGTPFPFRRLFGGRPSLTARTAARSPAALRSRIGTSGGLLLLRASTPI